MLFDHIRSTTSCKIACILVQVLFLLAFASPDSLFLSTCFLFIDSWWIFLASLALNWDCGRCHYPGPRNGLLSFGCSQLTCILINCVLKRRLWFKARAQGVEHNMISRRGLKRYTVGRQQRPRTTKTRPNAAHNPRFFYFRLAHMQQSACTQFPLLSLSNIRHFTYSFEFPTSAHAAVG